MKRLQQKVLLHGEGGVCLLLPHIHGMIFFYRKKEKKKKTRKENHSHFHLKHEPIYRAWKFTFIPRIGACAISNAVYIQEAMLFTVSLK